MNHNKKLEGISGVIRRYFYPKEFFPGLSCCMILWYKYFSQLKFEVKYKLPYRRLSIRQTVRLVLI